MLEMLATIRKSPGMMMSQYGYSLPGEALYLAPVHHAGAADAGDAA